MCDGVAAHLDVIDVLGGDEVQVTVSVPND